MGGRRPIVRSAYVDHPADDDFGQAGTLVREVMDDGARERLVDNVVGHLLNGVSAPVLERALEYWRRIDPDVGSAVADGVAEKSDQDDPKAAEQDNPARQSMRARG